MVISNLKIGTSYFFVPLKEFAKENIRYPWQKFEGRLRLANKKRVAAFGIGLQKRYDEAFECYMKAWRAGNSQGRIGAENVGHIFSNAGDTEKAESLYARIRDKK